LIRAFVSDPSEWRAVAVAAADWAAERFSPSRMVEEYLTIYRSVAVTVRH
jgi:hypothetical protein